MRLCCFPDSRCRPLLGQNAPFISLFLFYIDSCTTDYLYTHLKEEEDVQNRVCREQFAIYDRSLYYHLILQYR